MPWIFGLILIVIIILIPQPNYSKKNKDVFLKESKELQEMKNHAKISLKNHKEILIIRALRKKYNLSLVDAKKIINIATNG